MSWQDAKAAAEELAEKVALPASLKGKVLQVADFDTEEDCRTFYPGRRLGFHRMILSAMRKLAWKRGTKLIVPVVLLATPRFQALPQEARTDLADGAFKALDLTKV